MSNEEIINRLEKITGLIYDTTMDDNYNPIDYDPGELLNEIEQKIDILIADITKNIE